MMQIMKTLLVFIFAVFSLAFAQDELFDNSSYRKFFYLGTVNDNEVQMTLELTDKNIVGTYYYNLIGTPINLRVEQISEEQAGEATNTGLPITIEELDENGKAVAKFEGELSDTSQETGTTLTGMWSCDGCADPTPKPFTLTRVAEFARVSFQQNRIETTLTYPVFVGDLAVFNKALNTSEMVARMFDDFGQGQEEQTAGNLYNAWTVHSNFEIRYAGKQILSLLETTDWYTGGAHPNYGFADHTFLQKDGEVEVLELADLFTTNADLFSMARFVQDDLNGQEASLMPEAFTPKELEELSSFSLSPKGITFHFAPYAVASYAEGYLEVTVPFEEVKTILRSEIAAEFLE
jgi:hypothetical protein